MPAWIAAAVVASFSALPLALLAAGRPGDALSAAGSAGLASVAVCFLLYVLAPLAARAAGSAPRRRRADFAMTAVYDEAHVTLTSDEWPGANARYPRDGAIASAHADRVVHHLAVGRMREALAEAGVAYDEAESAFRLNHCAPGRRRAYASLGNLVVGDIPAAAGAVPGRAA